MSDRGPATTDEALRAAVRPFRLAAFALAGPLVRFESLFAGADRLRAGLEPDLGTLTVSPFGALPAGAEGGGAVAEGHSVPGGRRGAGAPAAPRPAAGRGGTRTGPGTRSVGSAPAVAETAAGAGSIGAAAAAAASDAIAAGGSLLGTLADAAVDALVPPSETAAGKGERRTPSTRPSPSTGVAGIGSLLDDLATAAVAESVLPGTGGAAVATRTAVKSGAALLDELAETVLGAFAGPKAPASTRPARAGASAGTAPRPRPPVVPHDAAADGGSTIADLVLRGLGAIGPQPSRPAAPATGPTTLEELASAAIAALAPAAEAPIAAQNERPAPRSRSEGETAVSRALDRVQASPTAPRVAGTAPIRAGAPEKNGSDPPAGPPAATAPSELAWLVNEALVEQARRHGVDLS